VGAGPQAIGVVEPADPDALMPQLLHHRGTGVAGEGETHQPRGGRFGQQGLRPGDLLQPPPQALAAGLDAHEPLGGGAFGLQQLQGVAQAAAQGQAGRGHFKTAAVAVEAAGGAALMGQAAPADQGGLGLRQQPLRQGHPPQPLWPAAPFVAGEGIDVRGGGGLRHRQAAHRLGRIHQQPRPAGMAAQLLRHGWDWHHRAGVPEQMGEHHQAGVGGEGPLEGLQHHRLQLRLGGGAAELLHRKGAEAATLAPRQLLAGGHHAGMLRIADQQLITRLPGQPPQGQNAAAGDVLREGEPVGPHSAGGRQAPAHPPRFLLDERPHRGGEGAQLLDALPAGGDRFQRWGGQRTLAAVVEVGLVLEGWTQPTHRRHSVRLTRGSAFGCAAFGLWGHHHVHQGRPALATAGRQLGDGSQGGPVVTGLVSTSKAGAVIGLVAYSRGFAIQATLEESVAELLTQLCGAWLLGCLARSRSRGVRLPLAWLTVQEDQARACEEHQDRAEAHEYGAYFLYLKEACSCRQVSEKGLDPLM